jgi:hypothetical protein
MPTYTHTHTYNPIHRRLDATWKAIFAKRTYTHTRPYTHTHIHIQSNSQTLGGHLEGAVQAIVTNGSTIYIGGRFAHQESAGHGTLGRVAMFNGVDWVPLTGGDVSGGEVYAVALGMHSLYVGGSIRRAGDVDVNR